jgi:hypothetical protein
MTMELVNDHQPRAKGIPGHREPAGHSSSEINFRPAGFTDHPDTLPPNEINDPLRSLEGEFPSPVPDDAGGRYRQCSDEHVNEPHRCGSDEATVGPGPAGSVANAEKDKDKDKDKDKENDKGNDKDKGGEQEEQRGNEVEEEEEEEEVE